MSWYQIEQSRVYLLVVCYLHPMEHLVILHSLFQTTWLGVDLTAKWHGMSATYVEQCSLPCIVF